MNDMAHIDDGLTMSSQEIASLVESRHDKVKQSVERLAERGIITLPPMGEVSNSGPGPRTISVYHLGKRDSYVVVAQLSPEFTARLVDRWQELEQRATPKSLSRMEILQLAMEAEKENQRLTAQVQDMRPKVQALERLSASDGALCITNAAKDLQMRPKDLFQWLHAHRWIYRRNGGAGWTAYQDRLQVGLLMHKITTVERSDGTEKVVEQVLVTPKGMAKLATEFHSQAA